MNDLLCSPKRVEGIHYLTGLPVSVEIADGKIASIERLNKLTDANNSFFIALD